MVPSVRWLGTGDMISRVELHVSSQSVNVVSAECVISPVAEFCFHTFFFFLVKIKQHETQVVNYHLT